MKESSVANSAILYRYTFFQRVNDITRTLRGIWLMLLFNLLAVFAFLFVPQGTDVLLSITEDAAASFQVMPVIWLFIALFFWSIASEFCTRFIIYLTDNSGRSLAPQRVTFRKKIQVIVARIFLFLPVTILFFAFIRAWLFNWKDFNTGTIILAFITILFILVVMAFMLYLLYMRGGLKKFTARYPRLGWLHISEAERHWVKKLYGILNDVRVDIPVNEELHTTKDLPRDISLPNGMKLPGAFIPYANNPFRDENLNIWMFRIPLSFYPCLRKQLLYLSSAAAFFILLFSFLPAGAYMFFGAASLICLSFGCWQVVFVIIHFLDKVQRKIPVRLLLLLLFLISSFYNRDHPVRVLTTGTTQRPMLNAHFDKWLQALAIDTVISKPGGKVYRSGANKDTIPVVFIAAEGGALRTGAFTSMILSKLSDQYPSFPAYIYCYSGVSGGTLGSNFFNTAYINRLRGDTTSFATATKRFFGTDFLAAATGKLVFGEIINYFIPWHIPPFDRAIALEKAWETGWDHQGESNILAGSFSITGQPRMPALFINTTEAESGLQCIWSNVGLDSLTLGRQRDLVRRSGVDLRYSTAINLSTRFPLVSPGATIFYTQGNTRERKHFVDGGYFENTGAETLLEVMKLLKLEQKAVKPYVIQFNFADDDSTITSTSIKKFSEIMEIVGAIYNTRSGRSNLSQAYLERYVQSLNGEFISLNMSLNTKQFPMSWILSNTAMERLNSAIDDMVKPVITDFKDVNDKRKLHRLFVYD
ncbi:MAG: hypothetical protein ACXWV0_02600 [Flavisolibacter sp.]